MKKHLLSFASGLFLMIFGTISLAQVPMLPQIVTMEPGYVNEVYYQFTSYNAVAVARDVRDISFNTDPESGSVLINDGNNAILWAYPYDDINGWAAVDTFDLYTWPQMFNDPDDWDNGAFNRNSTGYPDYGWGVYDAGTQIITGDSIFIMQLPDGSFKKVWIVEKNTLENTWLVRFANLDGSDAQEVALDGDNYITKDMFGLDMQINLPVDYQPVKGSWDILFTKYMAMHSTGVPVVVTGVLSNPAAEAKKFYPVDPDFNDWETGPWSDSRSTVGWDWKWFDLSAMMYSIEDSMIFYVKDLDDNVYRLVFTAFEGTSTGVIEFGIALVLNAAINDVVKANLEISLWPNPATDIINIGIERQQSGNEMFSLSIVDMTGRLIRSKQVSSNQNHTTWNIQDLPRGAYLLVVNTGNDRSFRKFFKR